MSIESKLAGINIYYSTHISFILETVISTMKFWGYNTTFMGDGSIKAIKDITRPFLFNSKNNENDSVINDKLEKISSQINQKPETIKGHILNMGLIYCFSLFEAFNKDYFQEVFIFKPDLMKSKKIKMDLEYMLQFKTIEELHRSLSKNLIEKFGYKDIDKLAEFISMKFNIDLKNDLECWSSLRESNYRRNCIVHNDGKMSDIYLKKLSLGKDCLNEELKVEIGYFWKCTNEIRTYMDFIDKSIRTKFNLKTLIESL